MNTVQSFWMRVKDRRARLTEQIQEQPWQPRDGSVFLVSLDNSEKGTTAGFTVAVPLALAAELLTKGTHRLADEQAVIAYRAGIEATRSLAKDVEVLRKTSYLLEVK
jgi:hypothetical protein